MSEIFEYFFNAYFHQDWRDDYDSSLAAVEDFANSESTESVVQLAQALKETMNNGELPQNTFNKFGGNFRPESEHMTVNEWIGKALDILDN
ncbi:contact-dependent growth inhibition system immunity protein [Vreelandella zhanjiangensis]|uniref:contact-dependent growth inhibition system immunity protein n=1 Tax=Vreelandella zhanjiangensis TaxID=1121960 RepID=UPI00035D490A|nr:contact-dependent growth inhibition system immunity protein [Halomonas zhanjiangensis]